MRHCLHHPPSCFASPPELVGADLHVGGRRQAGLCDLPAGLQSWDFASNRSPVIQARCFHGLLGSCSLALKDKASSPQLCLSTGPSPLPLKAAASLSPDSYP